MVIDEPNKPFGSTRCGRCHRILTDPKSIAEGIGPKCKAILLLEAQREQALHAGGLTRFFDPPEPQPEPEWLCMDCEQPTPQSEMIRGRCRRCHTEHEIRKIEARDRERTLPIVAGQFSEV